MGLFDRFRSKPATTKTQSSALPPVVRRAASNDTPLTYRNAVIAAASGRLTNSWYSALRGPNVEIENDLVRVRALSRRLTYNSVYASRFLNLLDTNIVGPKGLQIIAQNKGPDGTYSESINKAIVDGWEEWKEVADVTLQRNFTDIESTALRTTAMDGDCFVQIVHSNKVNRFGVALRFIDADLLDNTYKAQTKDGNYVIQGVELDKATGRPVGYWFWTRHADELTVTQNTATRVRVPADEIIHLARPVRPGQYRGLPWITPAIEFLARLDEYMDAEMIAAQSAASAIAAIEVPLDENAIDDPTGREATQGVQKIQEIGQGMILRLSPGEKLVNWASDHPSTAFTPFVNTILHGIAAALNISYNAISQDNSEENYASGRLGSINERDHYRKLQEWFIRSFHNKIFTVWLESALRSGALKVPATNPSDVNAVVFRGRGWKWADPKKDLEAYKTAIELNLISKAQVCAEQGTDYREVVEERYEEERLERYYKARLEEEFTSVTPETIDAETTTPTTEEEVEEDAPEEKTTNEGQTE